MRRPRLAGDLRIAEDELVSQAEDEQLGVAGFSASGPSAVPSHRFKCTIFWSCRVQTAENILLSTYCVLSTEGLHPQETELGHKALRRWLEG